MTETERLNTYLDWHRNTVLPGYQRQLDSVLVKGQKGTDWLEAIARTEIAIANIEWRLADETRKAPICGWAKLYSEHDPDCYYCKYGKNKATGKPYSRTAGVKVLAGEGVRYT